MFSQWALPTGVEHRSAIFLQVSTSNSHSVRLALARLVIRATYNCRDSKTLCVISRSCARPRPNPVALRQT